METRAARSPMMHDACEVDSDLRENEDELCMGIRVCVFVNIAGGEKKRGMDRAPSLDANS